MPAASRPSPSNLKRIQIISNSNERDDAMKHQQSIPVAAVPGQAATTTPPQDFFELGFGFPWFASAMLAFESCEVIRLRLVKLSTCDDAADDEACLMVSEKVDAMLEAGASLMAGASAATVIGRYREHVAANSKRLSAH
jgi:hypothetical protein